ncbi:MAG: hypothetical protein ACRDH6_01610 [Actinomycetota bacterium]
MIAVLLAFTRDEKSLGESVAVREGYFASSEAQERYERATDRQIPVIILEPAG